MNIDIRPLRTESDYDWALVQIEPHLIDQPPLGSPEADRFDALAALIGAY